jgi:hypothetical protein
MSRSHGRPWGAFCAGLFVGIRNARARDSARLCTERLDSLHSFGKPRRSIMTLASKISPAKYPYPRIAVLYGTVGPRRQLLSAPDCLRACGLTHWGCNLVFSLDHYVLNRCFSYVRKLMPRDRRHICKYTGDYIDLTCSFLILNLSLASAQVLKFAPRCPPTNS